MAQANKANENVSECSKTELCIKIKVYGCCHEETHGSHLNVTGVLFSVYKFEQKSHSLGLQKSTANQIRLNEMS